MQPNIPRAQAWDGKAGNRPLAPAASLRHNFSWTFLGNAVYAACQWLMLVLLAKLGNREMVGLFTLGFAVTAPVLMLSNLQLRALQSTDAQGKFSFGDYLTVRLGLCALALGVIGILALTYSGPSRWAIVLVGLAKVLEAISDVLYGQAQQQERMDAIARSLLLKGPLSLMLIAVALGLKGGALGACAGLVLAWGLVLVGYDWPRMGHGWQMMKPAIAGSLNPPSHRHPSSQDPGPLPQAIRQLLHLRHLRQRWPQLWPLVLRALPLGGVMLLISLQSNLPRYWLERHLGSGELGIFAALAYLMVVGNLVVTALGQAASPRLASYYAQGDRLGFSRLLGQLVALGAGLGLGACGLAWGLGKPLLTLLYAPEYAQHQDLLIWLMAAAGVGYVASFLGYGMTAAQLFRVQLPLFATVTLLCALLCQLWIPPWGIVGAAGSLLVSTIVQTLMSLGVNCYAICQLRPRLGD